jgi:hypothetical protein
MEQSNKPPYVSYTTFRNFVDLILVDGIPSRFDYSVMRHLSGASQSQLKIALRYLQLIDTDDKPTQYFYDLRDDDPEGRKKLLMTLMLNSYDFLFKDESGDFDLSVATPSQFSEKFRQSGLSGDTLRKAEAFFINLATDTGITLSKRIVSGRTSGDKPRVKPSTPNTVKRPRKNVAAVPERTVGNTEEPVAPVKRSWEETMLENLMEKFPTFNPEWDTEAQQKWLDQFGYLMEMLREKHSREDDEGDS